MCQLLFSQQFASLSRFRSQTNKSTFKTNTNYGELNCQLLFSEQFASLSDSILQQLLIQPAISPPLDWPQNLNPKSENKFLAILHDLVEMPNTKTTRSALLVEIQYNQRCNQNIARVLNCPDITILKSDRCATITL